MIIKVAVLFSLLLPLATGRRLGPRRHSERAIDNKNTCSCSQGPVNNNVSPGTKIDSQVSTGPPPTDQQQKGPGPIPPLSNAVVTSNQGYWKPAVGATWDITLPTLPVFDSATGRPKPDVDVYTIDLDEDISVISKLHSLNKKVICYFSAGTLEDFRSDVKSLPTKVIGSRLESWPEFHLDIRSQEVRALMKQRIVKAAAQKCDAIDPDNIDTFETGNVGLASPITLADAVDFVKFLATEAHANGMSIGQKNAAEAVPSLVNVVDFCVQEQCIKYGDCNWFAPYIQAGKPVFNIEYPGDDKPATSAASAAVCRSKPSGFSTIVKTLNLDGWVYTCN